MIFYTNMKTKMGILGLVRDEDNLLRIYLPNEKVSTQSLQLLYPKQNIIKDDTGFDNVKKQLDEYFTGKRKQFSTKLKLSIAPFYKRSLEEVAKVPFGETASYSQIAQRINNPKAARAVGTANARNPIPIIIPCHRIITSNGRLGGYRGGLKMKKYLLELEKNIH